MTFAKVYAGQTVGIGAEIIETETDLSKGLYSFSVVGLPDKAVEESRDRVSAAIKNSKLPSPKSKNQKVVISLAPANIKKEGPLFDLSIALSYLLSSESILFDPKNKMFLGELSLNGDLRPVRGVLPIVREAQKRGFTEVYVPKENANEASVIEGIDVYGVKTLGEVVSHIDEKKATEKSLDGVTVRAQLTPTPKFDFAEKDIAYIDFSEIKGQETAKRGLEIASAGRHNIALFGPPGTGKTLLARALRGILPRLTFEETLEATSIHSVSGTLREGLITAPPFRSPHHTSSYVSLVGGGSVPKPGEITLAHSGVLFLDEFPEFEKRVIEALRQPLEDRVIHVSRAKGSERFPANFILVAAMNPCPCGYFGSGVRQCTCPQGSIEKYQRKISGPIADRIDMWIEVGEIDFDKLESVSGGEESVHVRSRVEDARKIQTDRFEKAGRNITTNANMTSKDIDTLVDMDPDAQKTLRTSAEKLHLSARAYHRVIKLARTIADLDHSTTIKVPHILEAVGYRRREG